MSVKIKIKITKDIVLSAHPCKAAECAFALAVRDIFPDARVKRFSIYPFSYMRSVEAMSMCFPISAEMTKFIDWFDTSTQKEKEKFTEREFELEIPDWVIERINIDEVKTLLQDHPILMLV